MAKGSFVLIKYLLVTPKCPTSCPEEAIIQASIYK